MNGRDVVDTSPAREGPIVVPGDLWVRSAGSSVRDGVMLIVAVGRDDVTYILLAPAVGRRPGAVERARAHFFHDLLERYGWQLASSSAAR